MQRHEKSPARVGVSSAGFRSMVQGSACLLSPEACAVEDGAAFPSLHVFFASRFNILEPWLQLLGVSCADFVLFISFISSTCSLSKLKAYWNLRLYSNT